MFVRAVSLGATVAVAIGMWSVGAARGDTFVPLPDGHRLGPGVSIDTSGESALVSPSLAANGAGRVAWVSGNVEATVITPDGVVGPNNGAFNKPGTERSSTHGASTLTVGYVIGCQDDVSRLNNQYGGSLDLLNVVPGVHGSLTVPIVAGQVGYALIDGKDMVKSGVYHVNYQDQELHIQGCGGYAQARQYVVVEIIGNNYSKTTLFGQPFSIG